MTDQVIINALRTLADYKCTMSADKLHEIGHCDGCILETEEGCMSVDAMSALVVESKNQLLAEKRKKEAANSEHGIAEFRNSTCPSCRGYKSDCTSTDDDVAMCMENAPGLARIFGMSETK